MSRAAAHSVGAKAKAAIRIEVAVGPCPCLVPALRCGAPSFWFERVVRAPVRYFIAPVGLSGCVGFLCALCTALGVQLGASC
jgi:hypothetical protein